MKTSVISPIARRKPRRRLPLAGVIGCAIFAFWLLMAVAGPYLAPDDAGGVTGDDVFAPISALHPLGTDYLGRDMLSRILHGAPYTIGLALAAVLLASVGGTALAMCAAAAGGWFDAIVSRIVDTMLSIPHKLLALIIVAGFGTSVPLLIVTAGIGYMPGAYRIARALAVNVQAMDYVQAARARGEGMAYITCREMLPNMIRPVLADFGLRFLFIVLLLSGLSFLGLGIQPPHADWGSLVRENIIGLSEGAPAVVMPAIAIATLTIAVNMAIDGLVGRKRRGREG
ncbi:ABC transporter permease [Massilia pinisoli]|uniref:ABC transporter permease n=1 Tax=Massilia pinisoli TaxID=1772194 RepID=A0ABT1ZM07_9BURK|nr:ABC transporter permease [Massilia pinisoli]MCS0580947.1 ABC transporter permease [Massilia pinisoli]